MMGAVILPDECDVGQRRSLLRIAGDGGIPSQSTRSSPFPELEERVLERWRERDVFHRSLANREGAEVWSFYEGPPTANGRPGSHHVLSRVFKDVYPRYQDDVRLPGAAQGRLGLPRAAGRARGREAARHLLQAGDRGATGSPSSTQRCRESVFDYVEEWNRLTERIGFWIDLDDPYVTLEDDYIESVWWSLRRLWDEDRLYEGHKVVPYCPRCGTALSSHEVALGYQDVEDPSSTCASRSARSERPDRESPLEPGESLLVWTTTPWTLPERRGRGRARGRLRAGAAGRTRRCPRRAGSSRCWARGPRSSTASRARRSRAPPTSRPSPHRLRPARPPGPAADFVTTEDGTGLVHIAPAFGEDDYRRGEQNGIDPPEPGQARRHFDERVIGFEGASSRTPTPTSPGAGATGRGCSRAGLRARLPALLALRHAAPLLRQVELVRRHLGGPRPAARQQREDRLAPRAHQARPLRQVAGEQRRLGALARPLLGHAAADLGVRRRGLRRALLRRLGRRAARARRRGPRRPAPPLHRRGRASPASRVLRGEMRRVESVIDTWYDSGAMPFAQFHYPFENEELFEERFPADFICEAIDQTRGWFYTLLAESTLLFDNSSYRNCVCLGLILDPEGQKMSKSQGNVVEPWDVIAAHGADAFRWYYLTAQQPWAGYRFSVDTVGESVRQFLLTLWNTYSFWVLYANAEDLGPRGFPDAPGAASRIGDARRGPRPLGALAAAGDVATVREHMDDFDCTAAGRRSPSTSRSSPTGTCGSPAAASGRATGRLRDPPPLPAGDGGAARPLHPLPRRRDPPQPGGRRAPIEELGERPTRSTCATSPRLAAALADPGSRRRWRRCGSRSSSAAPPAPRPRRRCASRCAAP